MNKNNWIVKLNISKKTRYILLLTSLTIIILDQVSKFYAKKMIVSGIATPVIDGVWNWVLVYNRGAAFSFLDNQNGNWPKIFFGVVAFLVAVFLVHYLLNRKYSKLTGLAFSFILGGAIGNLVDRLFWGKVTDFIDWYYMSYHWPAFNLADSFICVGVTILIIEGIFFNKGK